jgi:hypothetical protein
MKLHFSSIGNGKKGWYCKVVYAANSKLNELVKDINMLDLEFRVEFNPNESEVIQIELRSVKNIIFFPTKDWQVLQDSIPIATEHLASAILGLMPESNIEETERIFVALNFKKHSIKLRTELDIVRAAMADLKSVSNEELLEILSNELQRRLPMSKNSPEFSLALKELPKGFRAMAATYELDVSLTMDDIGWHFGNWHSLPFAEETHSGLVELEAAELAKLFLNAIENAKCYWRELGVEDWSDWYPGSSLEKKMKPLNEAMYSILDKQWNGMFGYWVSYARKHPGRLGFTLEA